ncbi:hypothetical protein ACF3M2_14070 [Tissierella carlieri]
MSNDNKRLLKYLGIIFMSVLLSYRFPQSSCFTTQYIIKPIRYKGSIIYPSSMLSIALLLIGLKGLFNLERFADKNNILLLIIVITIIMPMMKWTLDVTRTNYHWLKGDRLKAIDIVDTIISSVSNSKELTINLKLELIDYGRRNNEFKIRVYLPKTLRDYTQKEFYDFENYHITYGNRNKQTVNEQIVIKLDNEDERRKLFDTMWRGKEFKYELYNENEVVKIINHGL